jgi:ABC-2 type transport system permease protein
MLARYAVRRDRVLITLWTVALVGVCYASAAATGTLYRTVAEQVSAARAINASPAVIALYGPILDVHSLGELAMTKMTVLYALFVAMFAVILVRRHTRVEEEGGLTDLVGATAVGSDAPLMAAVLEAGLVVLGIGMLAGFADIAGGLPIGGSLLFGASWVGIGWVATGAAAVGCQLAASARTCASIAAGLLGLWYVLRAVGDASVAWLSWLSPFGWSTRLRAWSEPRLWVLALYVGLALVLVVTASLLRARRDLGSGILAARPGPARGSVRLGGNLALTVRLHRPALALWTVASALLAATMGAIAPNVGDLLKSSAARSMIERLGGVGVIQDTLLAAELSVGALVLTCWGITVVGHAAADEAAGRTEQVLATGASRTGSFAALAVVALGGSAWLMLVTGLGILVGYSAVGGHGSAVLIGAAADQVPAIWVVVGLAMLLWSWRSRWSVGGWIVFGAFVTLGQIGELVGLPRAVLDLSPYSHVPAMPVERFEPGTCAGLVLAAVLLVALAARRYRVRDIG